MKINVNRKTKLALMLLLQIIIVAVSGILGKDLWYSIAISVIGIVFNMLVSFNISYGFLLGFVYAILNGILSYFGGIYLTFGFMIIMQAPVALFSFFTWQKSQKNNDGRFRTMNVKGLIVLAVSMVAVGVLGYFLLLQLNSKVVLVDTVFFVFSVTACALLLLKFKLAYVITLFSGIGGTILWAVQTVQTSTGISLAVFYAIVSLNSVIAIYNTYFKEKIGLYVAKRKKE